MNAKHLLAMLTLATAVGCNSIQRSSFDSFDEYPVYEGKWEEMTYSPAGTHFSLLGSYSSGSTCHVIRKGTGWSCPADDKHAAGSRRNVAGCGRR